MFSIPIVLSILQVFLLLVVFPYDTPSVLNAWGQKAKLREFLNKIYKAEYVDDIIKEIGGGDGAESDDLAPANLSYGDVFCGPLYRKATLVGISLAAFQQMTGINIIMFYSNTIFESGTSMSPNTITTLVGTVNFLATLVGMYLLSIAGRRTIMLWNQVLLAIVLIVLGILSLKDEAMGVVVMTLVFISLFEFGPGPITWLYMSEIMQDKAVSIATVINWSVSLVISAIIPHIIDAIGKDNIGYIFITVGILSTLGLLFQFVFMHETRGKTSIQIQEMFSGIRQERRVLDAETSSGNSKGGKLLNDSVPHQTAY